MTLARSFVATDELVSNLIEGIHRQHCDLISILKEMKVGKYKRSHRVWEETWMPDSNKCPDDQSRVTAQSIYMCWVHENQQFTHPGNCCVGGRVLRGSWGW
jgi:hypothetical protein